MRPVSTRPGPDGDLVRFLVDERDVIGFGTEAIGTDAGPGVFICPHPIRAIRTCTATDDMACSA